MPQTTPGDSALDRALSYLEETSVQVIADEENEYSRAGRSDVASAYQLSEESDDPLQVYVREVARVPILSADRERELMEVLTNQANADVFKRELIGSQLGSVLNIARQYRQPAGLHILDMIQRGNEGLMKASETFRAGRNYRFATHATVCAPLLNRVHQSKLS